MRQDFDRQLKLDVPLLHSIAFDFSSRHELEAILLALKHVYESREQLNAILRLIAQDLNGDTDANNGSPGLTYWEILVLAAVRLGCDLDYDALADLATNHRKLRLILGIGDWEENKKYARSTIQDNIVLLAPETIKQISEVIVSLGHRLVPEAIDSVRGDSFVVQTNIHFPTDANLIVDGVRKVLRVSAQLGRLLAVRTWQHWRTTFRAVKKIYRQIQQVTANKKLSSEEKQEKLKSLYEQLIGKALEIALKAFDFKENIAVAKLAKAKQQKAEKTIAELAYYLCATSYVAHLAERRVLEGETIPHEEKVFSIFEPHTELINRGKFPFPLEFGHRVFVLEDQVGFIVEHEVMPEGVTDEKVAVEKLKALQTRVKNRIKVASFDKGFWSPENLKALDEIVEVACLPKKGKRDMAAKLREGAPAFRQARRWHAGVESAIHGLVAGNGLTVCRDHGEAGYKRYVALGVLGRNLHTLGRILLQRAQEERPPLRRAA